MKLKYFGQSCFLLTTGDGTRILTDPFGKLPGLKMPQVEADIVTVSHSHFDHNNVEAVNGNFKLVSAPGGTNAGSVAIRGVESFHDDSNGSKRGKNVIFVIHADGLTLCHLGDLGHTLSQAQLEAIGKPDILLVPVGEVYTFPVEDALATVKALNPTVTIPMHYKLSPLGLGLCHVDKFLSIAGEHQDINSNEIELTAENLARHKGILVLKP